MKAPKWEPCVAGRAKVGHMAAQVAAGAKASKPATPHTYRGRRALTCDALLFNVKGNISHPYVE